MSDSYQAVYDAVRSRIRGCDVGAAVSEAVRSGFDASHAIACVREDFSIAASEMQRPSVLYRPRLREEGEQWIASYHEVVGYGETPAKAMADFDAAWTRGRTSAAAEAAGS